MAIIVKKKKVEENKEEKKNKLLESAFKLFTEKGINDTSIQNIVDNAGVAKGTFYLYFKDKKEIEHYLITKKSRQLFDKAIESMEKKNIKDYRDKVIYIIDYIVDEFIKNKLLLKFIDKNLSWAITPNKVSTILDDSSIGIQELFMEELKKNKIKLSNPEVKLYMVVELASSTIYSSITNNRPLPIDKYKPILYKEIKRILTEK